MNLDSTLQSVQVRQLYLCQGMFYMSNGQMSDSKAGNSSKPFNNNSSKIETKGMELLPIMTYSYDITGHVTMRNA